MPRRLSTLANSIQTWKKDQFYGYPGNCRELVASAHKFNLDDDLVSKITKESRIHPVELLRLLPQARLPYNTTWIEFNPRVKVAESRKNSGLEFDLDFRDTPDRMGLLCQMLPRDDCYIFSVSIFYDVVDRPGKVTAAISPICFFIKLEGDVTFSDMSREWETPPDIFFKTFGIDAQEWQIAMFGYVSKENYALDSGLLDRIMVLPSTQALSDTVFSKADKKRLLNMEVTENTGLARFLVFALAVLDQSITTKVVIPGKGHTLIRGMLRPIMGTTHVTINLPNEHTIVKYLNDHKSNADPHHVREHDVRGHWRIVTMSNLPECRHPNLESLSKKRQWCPKCGFQRTFVREHKRGDPTLGTIKHDYRLTA
jgi:hypothetical protein